MYSYKVDAMDSSNSNSFDADSTISHMHSIDGTTTTYIEPSDSASTAYNGTILRENEYSLKASYLPPCRICTRKASGFHYGVNTCEACKGFYRRMLRKLEKEIKVPYKCEKDGQCTVEHDKILCTYCRFQKCLNEGMSKQAIKQGRYTHALKTQYTKEIKGLEGADGVKLEPVEYGNIDENEMNILLEKLISVEEKFDPCFKEQFRDFSLFHEQHREVYETQSLIINPRKQYLRNTECEVLRETLKGHTDEKKTILELLTSGFDALIRYLVEFVKCIPGFRELSLTDQSSLLKASFLEFGFTGDCYKFNSEMGVMLGILEMPIEKLKTHKIVDEELPESLLRFTKKMQQLRVTCEELTLLRGIIVLFTDRCDLEDADQVEKIQWGLVQYLQHITRDSKNRLPALLSQLTALRSLKLEHVLDCLHMSPSMKEYPVVKEIISPT